MCEHCGCREFPAIAAFAEQHEQIQHAAERLRQAIARRDNGEARRLLVELNNLLAPHVATEEQGLFAELRAEEAIRATVEQLCVEHAQLDARLRPPPGDEPDWTAVLAALDQLRDHIDKEEYGVFPAAAVLLPIPAWDRITPSPAGHAHASAGHRPTGAGTLGPAGMSPGEREGPRSRR